MSSKVVELRMSNINVEPFDLVHQVTAIPGSAWESPYGSSKTLLEQSKNYRKYKNYLSNFLFLKDEKLLNEYNKLLERAERDGLLVFECTCTTICHLDAVRERLTEDLQNKGFTVTTNREPFDRSDSSDEEE